MFATACVLGQISLGMPMLVSLSNTHGTVVDDVLVASVLLLNLLCIGYLVFVYLRSVFYRSALLQKYCLPCFRRDREDVAERGPTVVLSDGREVHDRVAVEAGEAGPGGVKTGGEEQQDGRRLAQRRPVIEAAAAGPPTAGGGGALAEHGEQSGPIDTGRIAPSSRDRNETNARKHALDVKQLDAEPRRETQVHYFPGHFIFFV